jgi:hypothetical protein
MTLVRVMCVAALMFVAVVVSGFSRTQIAVPEVAGKWTLTSEVDRGGPSVLTMQVDGKKVTGRLVGPSGDLPLTDGEYAESKLSFSVVYQNQITVRFTGTPQKDGSLAGTMEYGQGPKTWSAVRTKE